MRLFIAIKFSDVVIGELQRIQQELGKEGQKLPEEFHITLKFLGEVDDNDIPSIKAKLSKIEFSKFNLALGKISVFQPNYIRVVHLDIEPLQHITNLFEKIHAATAEIKLDHSFQPHITLSRVKFVRDKKEFLDKLKNIQVKQIEFEVEAFYLIKSTLTEKGPIYEDLAEFHAKPL